jgi:Rrf2 family protein
MLTSKGKYGLKALLDLASTDGATHIAEIAARNNIPKKFLEAILLELKNAGFLYSKKGKGGGYELAKQPNEIMIGDVIRVLDGPLAPIACASRTAFRACVDCNDPAACRIRLAMLDVRDAMARLLDNLSLSELTRRSKVEAAALVGYDI